MQNGQIDSRQSAFIDSALFFPMIFFLVIIGVPLHDSICMM